MAIFYFVLGIILFIGLVVFHEFGHYLFARRAGVEVEEFGIGFPPRAWGRKLKSGMLFSLNWLPLGGFVKLKGEHDDDRTPGSYGEVSTADKFKILMAGVGMNLLAAFVLFSIVALAGMPKLLENQFTVASDTRIIRDVDNKGVVRIGRVVDGSPAAKAGLAEEDEIIAINGAAIDRPEDLTAATAANAGKSVVITVVQPAGRQDVTVTLNQTSPYLGLAPYSAESGLQIRRSTWSAPVVAAGVMYDFTAATFKGLGTALKGLGSIVAGTITGNTPARQNGQEEAGGQVAGPVGIVVVLYEISKQGITLVLFIIGLISLTLAIMNALPIPALDGGRLFVTLLFRLFNKPLTRQIEERIHATGFMVLMGLFVLITIVDVRRFIF